MAAWRTAPAEVAGLSLAAASATSSTSRACGSGGLLKRAAGRALLAQHTSVGARSIASK